MRKVKLLTLLAALVCAATMWAATGSWTSGSCTVTLTDDGTLTVSGNGVMSSSQTGWSPNRPDIKRVVIEDGVTTICENAFYYTANLISVKLGKDVQTIEDGAFTGCAALKKIFIPASVTNIGNGSGSVFGDCRSLADVYLYADASTLTWNKNDYFPDFMFPKKTTRCHVKAGTADSYTDKFSDINVTFVDDLMYLDGVTVDEFPSGKNTIIADGAAHYLMNAGNATGGYFEYSEDNSSWSTTIPSKTATGTYTVYYRLTDGSNSTAASAGITAALQAPEGTEVISYNYCYDCQRSPAYPKADAACRLSGFRDPFVGNGMSAGPWKLNYVANYDPNNDMYGVTSQVNRALQEYYGITGPGDQYTAEEINAIKRNIKVYALYQKQGDDWYSTGGTMNGRINSGYGLVVAMENTPESETALFIAGRSDFGCFLSDVEYSSSDSYNMSSTEDIAHPKTRDNVDGIETAMAALIGAPTNLTIVRDLYKDGFFNTLCLPFSLTEAELEASPLAGCQLYSLSDADYNTGRLDLSITEETAIEAGMPYLIKWTSGSDIASMTFTGVTVTASTGSTVTKGGVRFVGTIGRSTLPHGDANYLFLGANDNLYYSDGTDDTSMKGFRAYFIVDNVSGEAPRQASARLVIAPKMPTAVENVSAKIGESEKRIENGQLIIIKNGVKYNAQGQMVM